jgi:hypothetical protein
MRWAGSLIASVRECVLWLRDDGELGIQHAGVRRVRIVLGTSGGDGVGA